ncbi:MAG: TIGR04282 family arsenosugar biosynthesis glycosyltransferase [Flavobacteriales bacterium]
MSKKLLIIFTKIPKLGNGKSRLAHTIGEENAFTIFKELIKHTAKITKDIDCDKWVCYADNTEENSFFDHSIYKKLIQSGTDLGERMRNVFVSATDQGYEQIILIGSDCYELSQSEIEKGFRILNNSDFVFGPAKDGGYYLIGTRTTFTKVFDNKTWSTSTVLYEALRDVEGADLSHGELATLSDVDYESNLGELRKFID